MRKDHSQPVSEADRRARAAYRRYSSYVGLEQLAMRYRVAARTAQRVHAGQRDVPPGLAESIAAEIRGRGLDRSAADWEDCATALEQWANERRAVR